jgi:hypothetical protein
MNNDSLSLTNRDALQDQFLTDCLKNQYNKIILDRLEQLNICDYWLVAGCLFQTAWNILEQKEPHQAIKDYDIFYFDTDTSYEAEDKIIKQGNTLFKDLPIEIEIRNQARVHLWYSDKFNAPYPKLVNSKDGIDKFLIKSTCVGITFDTQSGYEIYAPYGLEDTYNGILEPNYKSPSLINYNNKAQSYKDRWPSLKLTLIDNNN